MNVENNLLEMSKSLDNLEKSGVYDVEKFSYALLHQIKQLEYFYCHLVKDGNCNETFYYVKKRPHVHELAYFNIGRGFPKELMDGHWCYVLKDLGYKMLVIPCTSIKDNSSYPNPQYELDIDIELLRKKSHCRIQLSDIRSIDIQRIDLRKPFCKVLTPKEKIDEFIHKNLFD